MSNGRTYSTDAGRGWTILFQSNNDDGTALFSLTEDEQDLQGDFPHAAAVYLTPRECIAVANDLLSMAADLLDEQEVRKLADDLEAL